MRAVTSISVPMAEGVCGATGLVATKCRPRSLGGGESPTKTDIIDVSPRRRGESGSMHAYGRAALTRILGRRGQRRWPNYWPKTTPPFPRQRQLQCWRTLRGWRTETLPRGVRVTSTPPRRSSTSSAPAVPHRALKTTANGSRITYADIEREVWSGHASLLTENHQRGGRVSAGVLAALLVVEPHRLGRKRRPVCVGMA